MYDPDVYRRIAGRNGRWCEDNDGYHACSYLHYTGAGRTRYGMLWTQDIQKQFPHGNYDHYAGIYHIPDRDDAGCHL